MATFHIHEDLDKENRVNGGAPVVKKNVVPLGAANGAGGNKILLQETGNQRTTFGVLSNVTAGNEVALNGEKAVLKDPKLKLKQQNVPQPKGNKFDSENVPPVQQQQSKVFAKAAEPFKPFHVYNDAKENIVLEGQKKSQTTTEKRGPLQEIMAAEVMETPMSVGDSFSPMSVDKSVAAVEESLVPRNDRERFFEVEEYQADILEYLREAEQRNRPKPTYMTKQPDINHSMRTILVDWLVEVCEEYRLHNETLCLAISYIDRFLSFMSVVRAKLQLVGTAAIFIASKYEEIYPPDIGEFVYITDDTYNKMQVLRMEQLILKVLSFDLTVPTTLVFTTLYCVMNDVPEKVKFLTMYLCELSLLEADPYLTFLPSQISAGALALARRSLELPMWSKMLETNTGYRLEDLKRIILHLNKSHMKAETLTQQAIQEKFKTSKYQQVSTIQPSELTEESFDKTCKLLFEAQPDKEPESSATVAKALPTERNEAVREMMSSLLFV